MNSDNLPVKKTPKVYKVTEKDYVKGKRDRERLKKIKPLIEKIHRITKQVK